MEIDYLVNFTDNFLISIFSYFILFSLINSFFLFNDIFSIFSYFFLFSIIISFLFNVIFHRNILSFF